MLNKALFEGQKFTKALFLQAVEEAYFECKSKHRFDPGNGYAQLRGGGFELWLAYGSFGLLRDIRQEDVMPMRFCFKYLREMLDKYSHNAMRELYRRDNGVCAIDNEPDREKFEGWLPSAKYDLARYRAYRELIKDLDDIKAKR
jgi:hypothetical protein